jgi:hypothetical protein
MLYLALLKQPEPEPVLISPNLKDLILPDWTSAERSQASELLLEKLVLDMMASCQYIPMNLNLKMDSRRVQD